jgi:hypothetical protein
MGVRPPLLLLLTPSPESPDLFLRPANPAEVAQLRSVAQAGVFHAARVRVRARGG